MKALTDIICGLAILAGLFLFGLGVAQITKSPILRPLDALVLLESDKSKCSGTHIGHGYVLTAAHCSELSVVNHRGDKLPTEVAFIDKERDVAVLHADAITDAPRAYITCKLPQVGEQIIAAGHPGPFTFTQFYGAVAMRLAPLVAGELNLAAVIGIDVTGMGGMSGGPVYVNGKIAAVFVAGPSYQLPTRGMFFATPLSVVCDKLPVPVLD